jgi:membrane-associated phospholipid phosphatase
MNPAIVIAIVIGWLPSPRSYRGPIDTALPVEPIADPPSPSPRPPPPPPRVRAPIASRPPAVEPSTPVRVRPALDLTITLGAAAPSLGLGLWVEPSLPNNVPTPGTRPHVKKIDEIALGRYQPASAIASDVMLAVAITAPFIYHAIEAGVRRRGWSQIRGRGFLVRYGTDVLILAEALAVESLLTEVLKTAIRRPRPYTYLDPADVSPSVRSALVQDQSRNSADWSFPSGHTAAAFTATTAGATLLTLELLGRSRWGIALAWVGGLGVASTTAVLRVTAGKHFTSDVITSALIGMGVGAAVPLAHWRPTPAGDWARRSDRARRWTLMPTGNGATLMVRM